MHILRWEGGRRDAAQRSHKRRCTREGEADDSRSSVMRGVSGAHGEEFEQEEEEVCGAVYTHEQEQGGVGSRDRAEPSPGEWESSAGGQCSAAQRRRGSSPLRGGGLGRLVACGRSREEMSV